MDIKNLLEMLEAVQSLAVDAIKNHIVGVDISDVSILTSNIGKIKDALEGIASIPEEVKDLDQEEIKQLVLKGTEIVFAILAAVK